MVWGETISNSVVSRLHAKTNLTFMMFYFDKSGEMKEEQTHQTYIHVGMTYHMCVFHPLCTGWWYCVSLFLFKVFFAIVDHVTIGYHSLSQDQQRHKKSNYVFVSTLDILCRKGWLTGMIGSKTWTGWGGMWWGWATCGPDGSPKIRRVSMTLTEKYWKYVFS